MALSAIGIAGLGYSIYSGNKQAAAQKDAEQQAEQQAVNTDKQAQEAVRRANPNKPDISTLLAAAASSSKSGPSGTMLTGPQGIDPNALSLGKNTLLGA